MRLITEETIKTKKKKTGDGGIIVARQTTSIVHITNFLIQTTLVITIVLRLYKILYAQRKLQPFDFGHKFHL